MEFQRDERRYFHLPPPEEGLTFLLGYIPLLQTEHCKNNPSYCPYFKLI